MSSPSFPSFPSCTWERTLGAKFHFAGWRACRPPRTKHPQVIPMYDLRTTLKMFGDILAHNDA
jgi:hypothetical protein